MKRYLPIVIGILLFALIIRLWKISLHDTVEMLRHSDWRLLLLALLTYVVMVYLKAVRWSFLIRMQGASYSIWNCFLIYMATLYLGNLTPGRAGDFAKVFYLNKDLKFTTGKSMASVLVDRVFDLYLLLFLGGVGIMMNPMPLDPTTQKMVLAVKWFFALLLVITLLAFNKKIGGGFLKAAFQRVMKQEHREKTDRLFEDFHEGMEAFYRPSILVPIILSLVSYVIFFWGSYLIALAIPIQIDIFYLSFCISVVNIVSLVTFLGMGTRETALGVLFGLVSLSKDQAFVYSLLLLFIGVILFSLLGLFCFSLKPMPLGSLVAQTKPVPGTALRTKAKASRRKKSK